MQGNTVEKTDEICYFVWSGEYNGLAEFVNSVGGIEQKLMCNYVELSQTEINFIEKVLGCGKRVKVSRISSYTSDAT